MFPNIPAKMALKMNPENPSPCGPNETCGGEEDANDNQHEHDATAHFVHHSSAFQLGVQGGAVARRSASLTLACDKGNEISDVA